MWRADTVVQGGELKHITVRHATEAESARWDGRSVPKAFEFAPGVLIAYGQTARSALNNLLTFSEEGGR